MHRPGPCVAVIPCWNEAATIGPLSKRVRVHLPDLIVVDDGSTDGTANHARAAGAVVERHSLNRGKGAALHTGLCRARALGFAWAITLDGDGQHPADAIPSFLTLASSTGAALVVGNRMAAMTQMPRVRRAANLWMSRQLSQRAGQPLPDSQCGFRLLQLDVWAQLRLECQHFEVESEMLLAFITGGFHIQFVPIPVLPSPRPSRIRVVRDTVRWLRWWLGSGRTTRPAAGRPIPAPSS